MGLHVPLSDRFLPGTKRCLYLPLGIEYQSLLVQDHRTFPFSALLFEGIGIRTAESTQRCLLYVLFMGLCHLGFSFKFSSKC